MKRRILGMLVVLGLATPVGILAATSAQPAPAKTATVAAVAATTSGARGLCIQNNTGLPFYLPLTNGKCPAASGSNPGYWLSDPPFGIVANAGAQGQTGPAGPAGPRGPKGDQGPAGDENVVAAHASVTLSSADPATQTITVKGLPAFSTGKIEFVGNNAEARPTGSTIGVVPVTPSGGSTSRSFTVKQTGLGTNSFVLTITVISFK